MYTDRVLIGIGNRLEVQLLYFPPIVILFPAIIIIEIITVLFA